MSDGHYAGRSSNKMHSFPSESGRYSPVSSPSLKPKVKRESGLYHEPWSSSPLTRETFKRNAEEGNKREEQYVAWINSQLKKRTGSRFVREIPRDTRDGIALIQLIEVLAGETLKFDEAPATYAAKKENVDQVLHFMASQRIKMRPISSKDIVDGNLRATMRLILALAAHFKPGSVKSPHPSQESPQTKLSRSPSAAAYAAQAAVAIGEVKSKVASVGRNIQAPFKFRKTSKNSPGTPKLERHALDFSRAGSESPSTTTESLLNTSLNRTPGRKISRPSSGEKQEREAGAESSGHSSGHSTPKLQRRDLDVLHSISDSESSSTYKSPRNRKNTIALPSVEFFQELTDEYDNMDEELSGTKEMLLHLQELLLDGRVDDDEVPEEYCGLEGSTLQEQLVIVSSRLDQREAEYDSLKTELNKTKEDCINLQGTKDGLKSRLNQKEQTIMHLQSVILKHDLSQQHQESEISHFHWQLGERDKEVSALRTELLRRERIVDKQKAELENAFRHIEELQVSQAGNRHADAQIIIELQQRIRDLHDKLDSVGAYETGLSARIAAQDEKVASLEEKILNPDYLQHTQDTSHGSQRLQEVEVIREAIDSLRNCFRPHDPNHHTLDTLEQSILSLLDRPSQNLYADFGSMHVQGVNGFDLSNGHTSKPQAGLRNLGGDDNEMSGVTTKVLYFTERTFTPFLTSIPKGLGEITLKDFKLAIDRPGQYRYHFKALDPEFGTVKEEVIGDNDLVPGWEGKIVAWVDDDSAEKLLLSQDQTT